MKSAAVKFVKSLHADSQTLSAMFLGYFVLLIVTATMILNSSHMKQDSSSVATSAVKTENVSHN